MIRRPKRTNIQWMTDASFADRNPHSLKKNDDDAMVTVLFTSATNSSVFFSLSPWILPAFEGDDQLVLTSLLKVT
jgi:hypothetical protein